MCSMARAMVSKSRICKRAVGSIALACVLSLVPAHDLVAQNGDDSLTGGTGAESFSGGAGSDTLTDFTPAEGDTQNDP